MENTEIHSAIQVDRIKIGNREKIIEQIIFSEPFKRRIQSGLRRILKEYAEAGFNVYIYKEELIFGNLALGTRKADDVDDLSLGFENYASVAIPDPEKEVEDIGYKSYYETKPRRIAKFHFHPRGSGFSGTDLDIYEDNKDEDALQDKKIRKRNKVGLYEKEDLSINLTEGLISPVIRRSGKRGVVTEVKLLAFSGQPSSNEYQAIGQRFLTIEEQAALLKKCGFNVFFESFPVVNGEVNFNEGA